MGILSIKKSDENTIDINTKTRTWTLQFEESMDRDGWFNAFMETKGVALMQTAESFDGNELMDGMVEAPPAEIIPGTNQYLAPPVYNEYRAESTATTSETK